MMMVSGHRYYASIGRRAIKCFLGANANVPRLTLAGAPARVLAEQIKAATTALGVDFIIEAAIAKAEQHERDLAADDFDQSVYEGGRS